MPTSLQGNGGPSRADTGPLACVKVSLFRCYEGPQQAMIAIALLTTKRLCLLLIFGVNLIAFAIPASARQEMAIAKITPGMTSANVTTALGTPIRTTKLGGGFLKVRFQYDAMTIDFDEDMLVAGIESSN